MRGRERKFAKKEHSYTRAAQIAHLSWHEVRGSRGHLREVKGVITDLINQVQEEVSPDAHHTSCYVERKLHEENMQKNMLPSAASRADKVLDAHDQFVNKVEECTPVDLGPEAA